MVASKVLLATSLTFSNTNAFILKPHPTND